MIPTSAILYVLMTIAFVPNSKGESLDYNQCRYQMLKFIRPTLYLMLGSVTQSKEFTCNVGYEKEDPNYYPGTVTEANDYKCDQQSEQDESLSPFITTKGKYDDGDVHSFIMTVWKKDKVDYSDHLECITIDWSEETGCHTKIFESEWDSYSDDTTLDLQDFGKYNCSMIDVL